MKKVLISGTVAFDEIETPAGSSGKVIGGAATYISITSSLFTQNLAIVSIVGEDFPNKEIKYLSPANHFVTPERFKNNAEKFGLKMYYSKKAYLSKTLAFKKI